MAHLIESDRFRLVRADVTEFIHVGRRVDAVLHFVSRAAPVDYVQIRIETLKVGSVGTFHALGLAGTRVPASSSLDLGGVRRPSGTPAARVLLGPRQPGRASWCL